MCALIIDLLQQLVDARLRVQAQALLWIEGSYLDEPVTHLLRLLQRLTQTGCPVNILAVVIILRRNILAVHIRRHEQIAGEYFPLLGALTAQLLECGAQPSLAQEA
ncbi:hypothetical protein D3C85_1143830 [compost metagenome]